MDARADASVADGDAVPWLRPWREGDYRAMKHAIAKAHGRRLYQLHLRLARAERDPTSQQKAP